MSGKSFKAWRDGRYVELAEVLQAIGPEADSLLWRLRLDEVAPSPTSESLVAASEREVDAAELRRLAAGNQIIDGEIVGFRATNRGLPVVRIRAVDSTSWDVESNEEELLRSIGSRFPDAMDLASNQ